MKVFITGITGFVGSHLADLLVEAGHEVYGLARSEKKVKEFNVPGTILYGDLSKESISKWVNNLPSDLDTVVHTAGIVHSYDVKRFYDINTDSSLELQKSLKEKFNKLHFVFVSSLAASKAVSHYGKSKKVAEEKLRESSPKEWSYHIIRPPMVIGPRDPAILDIYKMIKDGLVLFPGLNANEKTYSFINVFDLVKQIKALIESSIDHGLLDVSYPKPVQFKEIITGVENVMNKKGFHLKVPFPLILIVSKVLYLVQKVIKVEARLTPDKTFELKEMEWVSDGTKTAEALSFSYEYDLKSSLEMTYQDYKKREWL